MANDLAVRAALNNQNQMLKQALNNSVAAPITGAQWQAGAKRALRKSKGAASAASLPGNIQRYSQVQDFESVDSLRKRVLLTIEELTGTSGVSTP